MARADLSKDNVTNSNDSDPEYECGNTPKVISGSPGYPTRDSEERGVIPYDRDEESSFMPPGFG